LSDFSGGACGRTALRQAPEAMENAKTSDESLSDEVMENNRGRHPREVTGRTDAKWATTMLFHRVAAVLILALGVIGVAVCAAGAYGVWLMGSRLDRANDKVFDAVDRGLGVVEDRVPVVRQRVKDSKVTTSEITDAVRGWAGKAAQDRIASQLEIESRAEKLSGHLRAADLRLEASADAVRDVRQMLELGQSLGARVDPTSTDAVLEMLAAVRGTVQQAERAVDGVRGLASPGGGESVEDRLSRVATVSARVLLTLSEVDRRLDDLAARLSEIRAAARQLQATTSHDIVLASAVCYGLLAWGAAGQAALCGWGWGRRLRGRSSVGGSAG